MDRSSTEHASTSSHSSPLKKKARDKASKDELPSPSPDEVRQLVLEYLSHHVYLATARALSQPSSSFSPLPQHAIEVPPPSVPPPPPASLIPADPNGESEDAMMSMEDVPEEQTLGVNLDPDGDAEMDGNEGEDKGGAAVEPAVEGNGGEKQNQPVVEKQSSGQREGRLSEEELSEIEHRRDIQTQILLGNVPAAFSLIKLHYPTFLPAHPPSSKPPASAPISPSKGTNGTVISLSAPSSPTVRLPPSTNGSSSSQHPPLPSTPSSNSLKIPSPIPLPTHNLATSSLDPAHVNLDLLVQGFVETLRTVPLPPPSPSGSHPSRSSSGSSSSPPPTTTHPANGSMSMSASFHSLNGNGNGTAASSPASSSNSMSSAVSTKTTSAIQQASHIYELVETLKTDRDREFYRKHVVQVSSMFAYNPPENHPLTRTFLERGRRVDLAENVNAALVAHTGSPPVPTLETLIRRTTVVWDQLARKNLGTVPPWTKNDGLEWARLGDFLAEHKGFVLKEFMDERV